MGCRMYHPVPGVARFFHSCFELSIILRLSIHDHEMPSRADERCYTYDRSRCRAWGEIVRALSYLLPLPVLVYCQERLEKLPDLLYSPTSSSWRPISDDTMQISLESLQTCRDIQSPPRTALTSANGLSAVAAADSLNRRKKHGKCSNTHIPFTLLNVVFFSVNNCALKVLNIPIVFQKKWYILGNLHKRV